MDFIFSTIKHNVDNIIKHSLICITTNSTNKMEKRINKRGCFSKGFTKSTFYIDFCKKYLAK